MNETKHTPGPWIWSDNATIYHDAVMASATSGATVFRIPERGGFIPAPEDGRLMAAAPALLASLEEIITWMHTAHSDDAMKPGGWPMIDRARAEIAKAKGTPQP